MNLGNKLNKIIFLSLIQLLFFSGCSNLTLDSSWRNSEIIIDGSKEDWEGSLKYFEDEKVAIGISNDKDYIYFCLATSDNSKIMKIFRAGFTIWLDPQSSDGETIGIQYPIKREMAGMYDRPQRGKAGKTNNDENMEKIIEKFKIEQNEILIVNHDKFPLNVFPLENATGLELKINYKMHQLVYELKVPLANNSLSNLYVDALPNELVKVGFESGEFERPKQGKLGSVGRGGSDKGGMVRSGGRGGNKRGGSRPNKGTSQEIMNPIKFWMEVKLASSK